MKMVNILKLLVNFFAVSALLFPVVSYSATQSSYPTKTAPVAGDKALITDSADENKTKQATVSSLPISTAAQVALDGKANVTCFASESAFNACFGLDWQVGDSLGSATAADVAALFSGVGDYLKADGTRGTPASGEASSSGAVTSVSGRTGAVTLTHSDITDFTEAVAEIAGSGSATMIKARAYLNTATDSPANAIAKVLLDTESFDPNNFFDTATKRFTPNRSGYYQVNASVRTGATGNIDIHIYKNGVSVAYASFSGQYSGVISDLIYCNGTTDYIELYAYTSSARAYKVGASATYLSVFGPF